MAQAYGSKLNPYRKLREPFGVKGIRQSVVVTNNPSTIDQNQVLTVKFPNLGPDDVIVPGTARLGFNIEIESTDDDATIVENLGRAIVKQIKISLEGQQIFLLDNADVFKCYADLWLSENTRKDSVYQGIQSANVAKLRINAGNKDATKLSDVAVASAFHNRFCIPLDFDLLTSHLPFCQSALGDRLSYELTFNNYADVIRSTDTTAIYKITGISLEFDMVTNSDLARLIKMQYDSKLPIYYDRVVRHSIIPKDKSDTIWNINLNTPARSLKGILMIFEQPYNAYERQSEMFYNPKIKNVTVTIEGRPNQIYSMGLQPYHQYEECCKLFGGTQMSKDFHLFGVRINEYFHDKYALWLDMRSTDDMHLHGSGRVIENGADGINFQILKESETKGPLKIYLYLIYDAQLNISASRLMSVLY